MDVFNLFKKPRHTKCQYVLMLSLLLLSTNYSKSQNVEFDKKLGAENAKMVETQMGLYEDKALTEYVRRIGNRLVAELDKNPFDFQFHIADDPMPNAFALPGGYIYVTRGILALVISEDELACVMAHEIIHVIRRHSVKQMQKSLGTNLLQLPGAIVGTVVSRDLGALINAPIKTSNSLFLSSYSRRHEKESDTKGVVLAAKAGYNPLAMNDILSRLSKAVEVLTQQKETKSYFDDHPFTPDRVKNIVKVSDGLTWHETNKIAPDFPMPLDGLVFGDNPKKGLFEGQVFHHPDLNFTITFPDGWDTFNQPDAVGAMNDERQAAVYIGLVDPSKTPQQYAQEFEAQITKKHGPMPSRSEVHMVNNHEGYLISMPDNTGKEPMNIHILWLKMDNLLFKLIGLAPQALEPDLQKTAQSIHQLSKEEMKSIEVKKIKIIKAHKDEALPGLVDRSHSLIKEEIVALLNGIELDEKMNADQEIKIISQEAYLK